ncbi:MAG: hypothetical protein ACKO2L_20770 [Planctomycetaceae bacterium]
MKPDQKELPLPIHSRELRRTALVSSTAAAFSGGSFGLIGAFVDLSGLLGIPWVGSLAGMATGVMISVMYTLVFAVLFAATYFMVSLVVLLPSLLMLSAISRLRPVMALEERWLLVLTAAVCCGVSGVIGVGLWLPLEPVYFWGGFFAAVPGGVLVYYKAVPRNRGTVEASVTTSPLSHGRSVWEDLD